ncbi:Gfo/Idh/MocA family oxidoreductase [Paenibacillus sp. MZ04-78.2]|uniref:Gfo/Idh/MocA family protein n=1 Tax=Paenibacillus sp. MZ04-78.2 TaxID=2962034 RepID=UPI0020B77EBC|nr:Gfo/Idh/MocA family oxidoreductase [Paenibacillus sp. MZ04-78.2]MCP3773286.1 Gfo/Idh/MocA family oxidoreductase [Paenibacillus sp. MZ04-78.2]
MQKNDGMNYAPQGKPNPVVKPGEFAFAAIGLDHGHIYGMCNGLMEAGADLVAVYDPDSAKVEAFVKRYPQAKAAASEEEILRDPSIQLVAAAAIPSERGALGIRVMSAGKDYFTDKTPFTALSQLEAARAKVKETGRKYMVYYSERLHVESAVFAGELIQKGAIGRVVHVMGWGPHRLNAPSRPQWFFEREKYGGILCDIGSHQIEQFLFYTGSKDATVVSSRVANYNSKQYPELEDFGDATLTGDNGATFYFRVDWLTPDGLGTWGDGRTLIVGTDGYIELRKYIDIARDKQGDHVYLVNKDGERHFSVHGEVGYPFFGQLILDCMHRTENAMTQEHAFKAAELCLKAQQQAVRVE